ncbi:Glyceraldehyde-3-phosphate dehydrogenase [Neolewinella maritima]|uniref:Glyceraldehyde-3-phosphate dehydrogenase n=1 Tax=Neolewinella maritima TaxID=1383882 RepID=A0ABM9AWH5_9BACT|nr:type I glyceraldehyde-3-phosphate dehydrogenase [Neolewinella maritima]CAH0999022.1 Glyceraldehyde-3-phosphate dehydrogenase [Neolewinella maritima]
MAKIAINGFGRIGRITLRNLLEKGMDVVAINDLTDNATLAHLFKYDSVQGNYAGDVSSDENYIYIDGKKIDALSQPDPSKLPWGDMNVDVVLECTGRFVEKSKANLHIEAGAKKVLISAPAKGDVATVVLGVNEEVINAETKIYSNASCTTNCLAPMVKVLDDAFGVEKGFITTVHAYTADQNLQDGPHKDMRRARAAAINIVPTTTGAAKAVGLVLPHLDGKLDGGAMRVPVPTGSLTDLTAIVKRDVTLEEVDNAFKQAAEGDMKGILAYVDEPYVSSDIVGSKYSSLYDKDQTIVSGTLVKVVSWYDNEAGYSARLADLCERISSL